MCDYPRKPNRLISFTPERFDPSRRFLWHPNLRNCKHWNRTLSVRNRDWVVSAWFCENYRWICSEIVCEWVNWYVRVSLIWIHFIIHYCDNSTHFLSSPILIKYSYFLKENYLRIFSIENFNFMKNWSESKKVPDLDFVTEIFTLKNTDQLFQDIWCN